MVWVIGLPLAVEFASKKICLSSGLSLNRVVYGFDTNELRLSQLRLGNDITNEVSHEQLSNTDSLFFTSSFDDIIRCDVFIITVPTPITSDKQPDLTPLRSATNTVADALLLRSKLSLSTIPIVIYESTVYPGTTDEVCIPIIESKESLELNKSFFCGYSPERINPGDTSHRLTNIIKVTSGSNHESSRWIDALYGSIIEAGTHLCNSIKVAEAAKVIENTQRDLNIALINELSIIFDKLSIDTNDVLEAAGTKWNFLHFKPGLVGGHCIGVDPYYLTYKSQQAGYQPDLVLAGRKINDGMAEWISQKIILALVQQCSNLKDASILILGLAFKENCRDIRNTKVFDLYSTLSAYGMHIDVVDPWVINTESQKHFNIDTLDVIPSSKKYNCVVMAVSHEQFTLLSSADWKSLLCPHGFIFDLKGIVPRDLNPIRL